MDLLGSLIIASTDAILVADTATECIVFVNPAAEKLFECNPSYLIGKKISDLHPDEEHDHVRVHFKEFISTDEFKETNTRILTEKGNIIPVLIKGTNYTAGDGKKYATAYFKDLTYVDRLNEISQEQSHLVRRPVANILGITALLLEEELPEQDKKLLIAALRDEAILLDEVIRNIVYKTVL